MDATLVETHKQQAQYCYERYKAYQPLTTPYGATGQALNSAVKQLAMGGEWLNKRLKAVRFGVVNLPGRMVRHGRRLIIRLPGDHPSYGLLIGMRRSILALAADP